MKDAETLIAWIREGADELEKAHAFLDANETPRRRGDVECTLAARIALLVEHHEAIVDELMMLPDDR